MIKQESIDEPFKSSSSSSKNKTQLEFFQNNLELYKDDYMKLPEFFLFKTIPFEPNNTLLALSGTIAVSTDDSKFMTNSKQTYYSPSSAKQKWSINNNTTVLVSLRSKNEYLILGLPLILPTVFESILIHGKKADAKTSFFNNSYNTSNSADRFMTVYYKLMKPHEDKLFYHPIKVILQQIYRMPDQKHLQLNINLLKNAINALFIDHPDKKNLISTLTKDITDVARHYIVDPMTKDVEIDRSLLEKFINSLDPFMKNMFYKSHHVKMYLYTRQWNLLSRYYPFEILGSGLSLAKFLRLYELITTNALSLCFKRRIDIFYAVDTKASDDSELEIKHPIPELDITHYIDIQSQILADTSTSTTTTTINANQININVLDLCILCIYQALKQITDSEKHSYVHLSVLRERAIKVCTTNQLEIGDYIRNEETSSWWIQFLQKLETDNVIKIILIDGKKKIFLYENWLWEQVIGDVLCRIFYTSRILKGNGQTCIKSNITEEYLSTIKSNRGHLLCDEQKRALKSFIEKSITIINGPAGSGKTDFLQSIHQVLNLAPVSKPLFAKGSLEQAVLKCLYPATSKKRKHNDESKEEVGVKDDEEVFIPRDDPDITYVNILATSAQGNNASDLEKLFVGGSTTHRLILKHHLSCNERGFKSLNKEQQSEGYACMFSKVRVLIIEEGSLYTPELAAKLLGILALCAPLFERIIVVGDVNQLPSVNGGNFLRDIAIAFYKLDSTIHFTHNHRVDEESKILKYNADCILKNDPDKILFDNKVSILYEIPPQQQYETSMTEPQLRTIAEALINKFDMTVYNSHFITRTNKSKYLLDDTLKRFYWNKHHPHKEYKPYGFATGYKIVFNNNDAIVVANRIYVIVSIFDMDISQSFKSNIGAYTKASNYNTNKTTTTTTNTSSRSVCEVFHTHDYMNNYYTTRRYLLLFELSSFSGNQQEMQKFPTIEAYLENERKRFFRELIAPDTKLITGDVRNPTVTDKNGGVFMIVQWVKEIQENISPAFITTVNKFQGSQTKKIVYLLLTASPYETKESFYTSLTRAQSLFVMVSHRNNIKKAVIQQEAHRLSNLANVLRERIDRHLLIKDEPFVSTMTTQQQTQQIKKQKNE